MTVSRWRENELWLLPSCLSAGAVRVTADVSNVFLCLTYKAETSKYSHALQSKRAHEATQL